MGYDTNSFSGDFKLSITKALADQLIGSLSELSPVPLTTENLDLLESRPGIYELFLDNDGAASRIYVGKASKSLPMRLRRHHNKLSGRQGINLKDVLFQCLYVDEDLEASAPEKMLIAHYRANDVIPWNTNGFGNNDPGRQRDASRVKANHFDALYPVNLSYTPIIPPVKPGDHTVMEYLGAVKEALPFNLRFDRKSKTLAQTTVTVPPGARSVEQVLEAVIAVLPDGWQATALPGYIILYEEVADYESARFIWSKVNGQVTKDRGQNRLDDTVTSDENEGEATG